MRREDKIEALQDKRTAIKIRGCLGCPFLDTEERDWCGFYNVVIVDLSYVEGYRPVFCKVKEVIVVEEGGE